MKRDRKLSTLEKKIRKAKEEREMVKGIDKKRYKELGHELYLLTVQACGRIIFIGIEGRKEQVKY